MTFDNLLVDFDQRVACITINRPRSLNAMNEATLGELVAVFTALEDDSEVAAIILTGAGEKAFVAGADIGVMQPLGAVGARRMALLGHRLATAIESHPKPVIAAVNGFGLGGGCEIALACDIRIAADTARFGQPEINLGIIPGFGGSQRLPRLIGKGRALELILTGEMIDAQEAYRIGLVNRVTPPAQLLEVARQLARQLAGKGAIALRLAKEAVVNGLEMDLDRANRYEADLFALCFATDDQKEGMQAFLEKRPPRFSGR
ncbi:MAG: enoyl-CoA hydratase/isomerase family protein [Desulfuromonadales bacterium]|nr:enoyl-CoA hydratase/isomerase family protein [Desulfuromonadales bacterium]